MPNGENDDVMAQIRRSMSPYWNSSESGGAYLSAAGHEEAESVEIYKTLVCFFPEIDQASEDNWHSIAGKILPRVEHFFHTYHLVPGLYSITNNLRFLVENGEANLDMSGRSSKRVPQDEKIDVTFTQDHITLIRHMNTRIYENCVEIMDYKRPYGDCFYYYIDTAHALDEPILMNSEGKVAFSKDTEGRYYQLHTEMLFAIQAFWTYATLPKP